MKGLLLGLLLLAGVLPALGQKDGSLTEEKRREFEAQKVAYFTQEMALTPEEAAVFWPLYNEMQRRLGELGDRLWELSRTEVERLSEAEVTGLIDSLQATERRMQEVRVEYYARLVKAVSARKVWLMMEAERKFRHRLWRKFAEKCEEEVERRK